MLHQWEHAGGAFDRLPVPGGWIYSRGDGYVFVPDPAQQGAKAAYQEGYLAAAALHGSQGDKVKPTDPKDPYDVGYTEGYNDATETLKGDKVQVAIDALTPPRNAEEAEALAVLKGDKVKPETSFSGEDVDNAYNDGFADGSGMSKRMRTSIISKLLHAMDLYSGGEPSAAQRRINEAIQLLEGDNET